MSRQKKMVQMVMVGLAVFALAMSPMTALVADAASVSAARAKQIARNRANGGTVVRCKRDYDDGGWEYDVTVIRKNWKYEMDIRVSDGAVNDYEAERISILSKAEAKRVALDRVGGGRVTSCKLGSTADRTVYRVAVMRRGRRHTMNVHARTGHVTNYNRPGAASRAASNNSSGPVSAERAKQIAKNKVGGGTVTKCERDYDDGREYFEITIIQNNMEYDIDIGVKDGKIYQFESEPVEYDDYYDD